jgi:hypothetical protein
MLNTLRSGSGSRYRSKRPDRTFTYRFYFSRWPYFSDAVNDNHNNLPSTLSLSAYPNPFNSSTALSLGNAADAEVAIFDITGRQVAEVKANNGKAVWDAGRYSSGIYFARIREGNKTKSVKLVLLK